MTAAVVTSLAACSDDDNNYVAGVLPEPPEITATSIQEGATVAPGEVEELTVTYSAPIALNKGVFMTLNGRNVIPTVLYGNTLSFPLSLVKNTEYELVIPETAVIANKGLNYGPAFTLKFRTNDGAEIPDHNYAPVTNPNATQQVKNVYDFLIGQSGKKTLSGAMANVNNNNNFADWVYDVTGKYPALTGYDFIHMAETWIDYNNITPAKTQWENNGLVSYMWHWRVPNSKADYDNHNTSAYNTYVPGANESETTEFDIREALKDGTWQNQCIMNDIDQVAGYLKKLAEAGIPVIWRPLHEAAGNYDGGAWFWWGRYGDEYTRQLWILMHDRLVNHHGLNNLIWVWTAQFQRGHEAEMKASYPGDEYVDIVGVDLYPANNNSQVAAYRAALEMTEGRKMVTLSEVGMIPDPQKCADDGAAWAWFMEWYTYNISPSADKDGFGNTREAWTAVMNSKYIITREQMPSLK